MQQVRELDSPRFGQRFRFLAWPHGPEICRILTAVCPASTQKKNKKAPSFAEEANMFFSQEPGAHFPDSPGDLG